MLHITAHILQPFLAPWQMFFNGIETGHPLVRKDTLVEPSFSSVEFTAKISTFSAWQAQVSGIQEGEAARASWVFGAEFLGHYSPFPQGCKEDWLLLVSFSWSMDSFIIVPSN